MTTQTYRDLDPNDPDEVIQEGDGMAPKEGDLWFLCPETIIGETPRVFPNFKFRRPIPTPASEKCEHKWVEYQGDYRCSECYMKKDIWRMSRQTEIINDLHTSLKTVIEALKSIKASSEECSYIHDTATKAIEQLEKGVRE